jgi:hypothetical protein
MTPNQIRARLIEQDLSFRQFALARGYDPRTVTYMRNPENRHFMLSDLFDYVELMQRIHARCHP